MKLTTSTSPTHVPHYISRLDLLALLLVPVFDLPPPSVLAMHQLTERADCVFPIENQVPTLTGVGGSGGLSVYCSGVSYL